MRPIEKLPEYSFSLLTARNEYGAAFFQPRSETEGCGMQASRCVLAEATARMPPPAVQ